MEVTFDWFLGTVQRYRFFTIRGDQRSIGYTTGLFVAANYAYDHYKQLAGFMTYRVGANQNIKAAGSFDSFCNHLTNYSANQSEEGEFEKFEAFLEEKGIEAEVGSKEHFDSFHDFHEDESSSQPEVLSEAEAHFEAFREFVDETGSEMSLDAFEQWHNSQVVKESANATGPVTWDSGSEDNDGSQLVDKEIVPDVLVDAPEDATIVLKTDSESK